MPLQPVALPENVLETIFLHLSPYAELKACRLVCRQWRKLVDGAVGRLHCALLRCKDFDWLLIDATATSRFLPGIAERCSHAACYHPSAGVMYVFGGCTAAYTTFNDLWKFDLGTEKWARLVAQGRYPSPKACATIVLYKEKLVLFGGWSKSSPNPIHQTTMFFNELHEFDPITCTWSILDHGGMAPHLAGHAATVVGDSMVVFGGSDGSGSSNNIWIYDFLREEWQVARVCTRAPAARYGHSQVLLDPTHMLVLGGCGGPNLIFNDVWILNMVPNSDWEWSEVRVANPHLAAPQVWSHPVCKVGENLVLLSKPLNPKTPQSPIMHRPMSSSLRPGATGRRIWTPPQCNLIPPRKKFVSSKSLDERDPNSVISKAPDGADLQRAHSIPAIIVGEIPKLVVSNCENSDSQDNADTGNKNDSQHVTLKSSSLVPTPTSSTVEPIESLPNQESQSECLCCNSVGQNLCPGCLASIDNQAKRLEYQRGAVQKMQGYIRAQINSGSPLGSEQSSSSLHKDDQPSVSGEGTSSMGFRPNSPPPKAKQSRCEPDFCRNPMDVYVLDISKALSDQVVTWSLIPGRSYAPEDTILYSLVRGCGELVMFGGMRSRSASEHRGLDVAPFSHSITNQTYILKPPMYTN